MKDVVDVWTNQDILAASAGVCSRCSGRIDHSVTVCEDHEVSGRVCDHCDRRYAVLFEVKCGTCHYNDEGIAITCLLANTARSSFLTEHGMNSLVPETREPAPGMLANYEEDVHLLDPLSVALTFAIDDGALTLTIDEDVSVVDVTRDRGSESS